MRTNKPNKIIVHHSNGLVGNPCAATKHHTVYHIDRWHKQRWPHFTSSIRNNHGKKWHVGYHYCIWKNGQNWEWTQTRRLDEEGAHCIFQNLKSIGVCIIGNYDACSGEYLERASEEKFKEVYEDIRRQGTKISPARIYPHRKYASKSCYGDSIPDDHFQNIIQPKIDRVKKRQTLERKLRDLIETLITRLTNRIVALQGKRLSTRERGDAEPS